MLLDFLMKKYDGISRNKAKAVLSKGGVMIDGTVVTQFDHQLEEGMVVEVSKKPRGEVHDVERHFFDIVYEDNDIVVVNKAPGVLSMGVGENSLNMKMLLDDYFARTRQKCRAHVVHRLDVRTSGLLLYAKTIESQCELVDNWQTIVTDRRYVAVVEGMMSKNSGHIESWLTDTPSRKVVSSPVPDGGKWASTDWRMIDTCGEYSLLELHLHTGRKNQIRVHMQVLGHPIVGDFKYGATSDPVGRLGLHAFKLAFYHPITHKPLSFETKYPSEFTSLFDRSSRNKR